MKPDTKLHYRFESTGRPKDTCSGRDSVREIIPKLATWLLTTYMGQKIRITIARSEAELATDRRSANNADVLESLEAILAEAPDEQSTDLGSA